MPARKDPPAPSFWVSLIPFAVMGGAIVLSVFVHGGTPHVALFLGSVAASLAAWRSGSTWGTIREAFERNIQKGLTPMLLLLLIGMLIGTWIASGIVPALLYLGVGFLHPLVFLPLVLLFCSLMSVLTGSSWVTIGTIGVAAIGVGAGLGVPPAATAGAVVSGAFFGDKISPLSDSTNLAASVFGICLLDHIRHMLRSTLPALGIALVVYGILGFVLPNGLSSGVAASEYQTYIRENFRFSPLLAIPPAAVVWLIIRRVPAVPSLAAGVLLSGAVQILVQGGGSGALFHTLYAGFEISSGWPEMDQLLSRGGISSMYPIITLTLLALTFGGIMRYCGMLDAIVARISRFTRQPGPLVAVNLLSSIFINAFTANQYLSVIIPGQMLEGAYESLRLSRRNMTRALEAGGTLTSPLIPWNASAVFVSGVLGVETLRYLPFAVVCWLTPLIVAFFGFAGISMERDGPVPPEESPSG